jgi:CRP-like cAMP-binding protein
VDVERLEDALVEARLYDAKTRFLHTLMTFYERYGRFEPATGHIVEIPLARQDLAALVGIAPETVSRTIRKLERDNIAQFYGNRVLIPDLEAAFAEISE